MKRTYGMTHTNLTLTEKAQRYYNSEHDFVIYEHDELGEDPETLNVTHDYTYSYKLPGDPEAERMSADELNETLEYMADEWLPRYYIVTELERKDIPYDTAEEAIEAAKQTLPRTMKWEIREDDRVGGEETVYTHYIYHVKPEYYDLWGAYEGFDTVTSEQIEELAREWEKTVDELMEQVEEV